MPEDGARGVSRRVKAIASLAAIALVAAVILYGFRVPGSGAYGSSHGVLLVLDREVYARGDTVKVEIVNRRLSTIYMGLDYTVYRHENGSWVPDETLTPDYWPLVLISIGPWGSYTIEVKLANATPGVYKIAKEVWLDDSGGNRVVVEAEFRVSR